MLWALCAGSGWGACTFDPLSGDRELPADGPRTVSPPDLAAIAPGTDVGGADLLAPSPDLRPAPDLSGCPGRPCDLVCQNCGRGARCSLDVAGAIACLADGSMLPGHACSVAGGDDCAAGAVCLAVALTGSGACFRFCRIHADCPGGGLCDISVMGTGASVCTEPVSACAIVPSSSGCSAGTTCYPVNDQGQTGCHVAGTGGLGAQCGSSYDCLPGHACFVTPAGCQKLCRKGSGTDCPPGKTCTSVGSWTTGHGICT